MRVLLTTYGSRGDVEPLAALAAELLALGAEVRVCAPPDEEFTGLFAGAELVGYDRPWRSWERPVTVEQRTRRVSEFIDAQYGTLLAAAEGCDVMLGTAMSQFPAGSVAEQVGLPYRFVTFAPIFLADLAGQDWGAVFGPALDEHRRSVGLPPVEDVARYMFTDRPWLAADRVLAPLEGDFVRTGAWIRPDCRPLPAEVADFLDAGEPPVYVGYGSMRAVQADAAQVAVEAVRAVGRRVLLGRGWAGLAAGGPNLQVVGEANQQALFPRTAAVVHHGGAGTTTTAARAGVPQAVVPQAGGALRVALDSSGKAQKLADEIRTDGAAEAARLLLSGVTA